MRDAVTGMARRPTRTFVWLSVLVGGLVQGMSLVDARERPPTSAEAVRQRREAQFREWDTNKDGVLELSEFHGHPGNFRAMDCNHDGVLSLEEFVNRYHCGEAPAAPSGAVIRTAPTPGPTPRPTATPPIGLTAATLPEFRRLAHDLDRAAFRMLDLAEPHAREYADGGRFLSDLRFFTDEVDDLYIQSTEANVRADQVRGIVGHLLQDAHETDKAMRQARVFPQLWNDWAYTRGILNRMAQMLQ